MQIEPLNIADYDKLTALWRRCGLPFDKTDRDSRSSIENQVFDDRVEIFVLKEDNDLIGSVIASSDGRKGWINRLAVDPDFRGRRLAALLLERAEAALAEMGVSVIAALIEDENTPSMAAFRHSDYQPWQHIVYFRKVLPRK